MIGIIDYGIGNLRSVEKALQAVGAETIFLKEKSQLSSIQGMVLPGVGAFGDCIRGLRGTGLWEDVLEWIHADKPFFGICVGYQMLFEGSEETSEVAGLGVIKGRVIKFQETTLKVPQIGWNEITVQQVSTPFLKGIRSGDYVYFVHSYYPQIEDLTWIALTTNYGVTFPAAIGRGNLFATQFHPEKSQQVGLQLMRNFVGLVEDKMKLMTSY